MKAGRENRVPLSHRAVEVLKYIASNRNPKEHFFSGWKRNTGLRNNAFLALLKKMQRTEITPHGFRSTFRNRAPEKVNSFQNETTEVALAHTIKNKAEAAYRRRDLLERRREYMGA